MTDPRPHDDDYLVCSCIHRRDYHCNKPDGSCSACICTGYDGPEPIR